MRRTHLKTTAAIAIAAGLLAAAPAGATYGGSPGEVAYVDTGNAKRAIRVTTPGTAGSRLVWAETMDELTMGFASAPAWSPDGRRLAFAAKVPDPGLDLPGAMHTAIFVWDQGTDDVWQVSEPPDGLRDQTSDGKRVGHRHAEFAPAWSPDGNRIAFIRMTVAAEHDEWFEKRGANIRTVSVGGGASSAVTMMYGHSQFTALSWAGEAGEQGSSGTLVGYHVGDEGGSLMRVDPATGGASALLSGAEAGVVRDFDVAPDGCQVVYSSAGGSASVLDVPGCDRPGGGSLGWIGYDLRVRFSPTGNGPLHLGSGPGNRAGLLERRLEDPTGDVWEEDPDDRWVGELGPIGAYPTPVTANPTLGRSLFDVQSQRLPIIAIPGFAGSKITCGLDELWPPGFDKPGNGTSLLKMALSEDGRTNAGCAGAGPTTDPNDPKGLVSTALTEDVYKPMEDFLGKIAPDKRGYRFSWDWRKAPGESLQRLDDLVRTALETDFARGQGLERVVLFAHSYGGLLAREYVRERPAKVARVLSAGSPFWGAPKSLFFIGFGIENPLSPVLDLDSFLPNDDAKTFARNLAGVYHLLPSDRHDPWLTVGGEKLDQTGVRDWITRVAGGNGALFDAARSWHTTFDGFTTQEQQVEWRAVIGVGLETITGVEFTAPADPGGDLEAGIRLGSGDSTVPGVSANQGSIGTHDPYGDDVHVQQICGVKHVPLPGAPQVAAAYEDYLLSGRTPRKLSAAGCRASGWEIRKETLDMTPGLRTAAAAQGGLTLREAADQGRIQLLEIPGKPVAIVDDTDPVTLDLADPGETVALTVTRWDEDVAAGAFAYGPLRGAVAFTAGPGGRPRVTVDGEPVEGTPVDPGPPVVDPPPGPVVEPTPPCCAPAPRPLSDRTPPKLRALRVRGAKVTLTLSEPATLHVTVARAKGRPAVRLTRAARAGRVTLRLPRRRLGRGRLRLGVVAVDAAGNRSRAARTTFRFKAGTRR